MLLRHRVIGIAIAAALFAACSSGSGSSAPTSEKPGTSGGEVSPAGDIPDNQAFVTYTAPDGSYAVDVPEGWARSGAGSTTTFTDKLNSIELDTSAAPTTPTVETATSDVVPALAARPGFRLVGVTTVPRTAGPAVRIAYRADGSPDPVTGRRTPAEVERYEFWRDGRQLTITFSSPVGADNVDPWKTVTDSVRWLQ